MLKSGWLRLWVLLSGVSLLAVAIASATYVWGIDACYRFATVSVGDNIRRQDRELGEQVKRDAMTMTICGKAEYSTLLALEDLASRGVVTQVGLRWLESRKRSRDHGELIVLDGNEIKASAIIKEVSHYVRRARFRKVRWLMLAALSGSAFALALGVGVAWIRRGFAR